MEHYFTNNENLKSELRKIRYDYQEYSFSFWSDHGVFSKDKVDYGSKLLVETILEQEKDIPEVLDVGCGYGFMGIVIGKVLSSLVTLIDVNKRAVHLADLNIKENGVSGDAFFSDCYQNIEGNFDVILTNPPIRAGKKIVLEILLGARQYLKESGRLWFVIRRDQGAESIVKELKECYSVEVVKKDKGFFVMRAKSVDNKV